MENGGAILIEGYQTGNLQEEKGTGIKEKLETSKYVWD